MQVCPICKSDQLKQEDFYLEGMQILARVERCECCGFWWKKHRPLRGGSNAHYINQQSYGKE